jgi:putative membrane-bound dehydrogenase-like protein
MQTISSLCRIVTKFLIATFMLFAVGSLFQATLYAQVNEPELNVRFKSDRSAPLPPLESLNNLVLTKGYRVELVACEPQVIDPVSARFDSLGRLWVVEMRDYPFILEGERAQGQIRILKDLDHDGHFESATTFASALVDPTGLAFFRDGVIVTVAGKIVWLRDTDGDLQVDQEETWFEGFTTENEQLRANHPTWLINGTIHVASGLRGGEVRSHKPQWSPPTSPVPLAGRDFEFSPWGSAWRAVEGNSQFGFWQDSAGNSYACSNRNPCRLLLATPHQAARNPLIPLAAWTFEIETKRNRANTLPF